MVEYALVPFFPNYMSDRTPQYWPKLFLQTRPTKAQYHPTKHTFNIEGTKHTPNIYSLGYLIQYILDTKCVRQKTGFIQSLR